MIPASDAAFTAAVAAMTPRPTEVRRVPEIKPTADQMPTAAYARYSKCLNKLYTWTLTEYDTVCWLDADLIVTENLDPLLDLHLAEGEIAAAPGCSCNALRNARLPTAPERCPFNNPENIYINSGVLVTRPSNALFTELLKWNYDHPLPDQDAFNIGFAAPPYRIRVLPTRYNYLNHLPIAHPAVGAAAAAADIAVFHFGYNKPWLTGQGPLPGTEAIAQPFYEKWLRFKDATIISS
jgi:alpha-N-acetylglucosamine transferase